MYFGKNGEDEEKVGERRAHGLAGATLVHRFTAEHLTARGIPDRKLCMALDIFAQKSYRAPASNVRLEENISAACRTIAILWPHISPPAWWPLA